jgi:hypothetical protein
LLNVTNLGEVIAFLRETISERKLRLLACGCCRLAWGELVDDRSRQAVRVSETFADGLSTGDELASAIWQAEAAIFKLDDRIARLNRERNGIRQGWLSATDAIEEPFIGGLGQRRVPIDRAMLLAQAAEPAVGDPGNFLQGVDRSILSSQVIKEIVGNPFRPAAIEPAWLTSTVVALARGIYDDRAFDRMPILGDALEDAGCDNADILAHCRDANATHVRGCWVVDLVLGKE